MTCYIANTEEEGQQCGQQFANDDSIVAVVTGPTFIGTESFYAALAGSKPVVAGVSVSAADTVQAERSRALRRRQVHPRAVRDVRPRHVARQVGGADLSGRLRPG